MQPIIYDVAVSIDGYIAGPEGDISQFPESGDIVEAYLARLSGYAVAIMGRHTYEFGYRYGLKPGENPYSAMTTWVFSRSLVLPCASEVTVQRALNVELISTLKATADGPIYLCGGGEFAGSLLSMGLIDELRLKRAPVVLGKGIPLFDSSDFLPQLRHVESRCYDDGGVFQVFDVEASKQAG